MLPSPLKILLKKVIELSNNSVNITIPQKRKRGRPRKHIEDITKTESKSEIQKSIDNVDDDDEDTTGYFIEYVGVNKTKEKKRGRPRKRVMILDDKPTTKLRNIRIINVTENIIDGNLYYFTVCCSINVWVYNDKHKLVGRYFDDKIHFYSYPDEPEDIEICFKLCDKDM